MIRSGDGNLGKWMKKCCCILFLAGALFLNGCDRHELEDNAFPLALGIEREDGEQFHMYAAYPNLADKDAKKNALAKDSFWDDTMEKIVEGTKLMSESSSRNVNLNHLKVLILDQKMMDGGEQTEQLVEFFREKRDAAWNTYVLLCEKGMADFFSNELQLSNCLGIYLEDLLEGWTNLKAGTLVTVGDLMSQYYNADETLLIPVVTMEKNRPVVKEFARIQDMKWKEKISMERVFEKYTQLKIIDSENRM